MDIAELLEKLKQMPQNALVVAEGYEDGVDTIKTDSKQVVFLNAENKSDKK